MSDLGPRYVRWCLVLNSELLEFTLKIKLLVSVLVSGHVGPDADPDPRIRTSD